MELSNNQQKLVQQAAEIATYSDMNSKHGTVIVNKHRVVAKACNTTRRCIRRQFLLSCHAEISGLYRIKNIKGSKVRYVGSTNRSFREFNRVQAMS